MDGCSVADCRNAHRARGLCATHYNQRHQPTWHAAVPVACTVCGVIVDRRPDTRRQPTCSTHCRQLLQHGADAHAPYSWSLEAAKRARDAGATVVVPFDRLDVFDRDRWICYLCHLPVDRDASAFDRSSPTVDHVVPLSRGGEHAMRNAACAHLGCNSAKQDRTAALAG